MTDNKEAVFTCVTETQAAGSYAGIGSRETPASVLDLMSRIARKLGARGWTLRTGGAEGADLAFYAGAYDSAPKGLVELCLPWYKYNLELWRAMAHASNGRVLFYDESNVDEWSLTARAIAETRPRPREPVTEAVWLATSGQSTRRY